MASRDCVLNCICDLRMFVGNFRSPLILSTPRSVATALLPFERSLVPLVVLLFFPRHRQAGDLALQHLCSDDCSLAEAQNWWKSI